MCCASLGNMVARLTARKASPAADAERPALVLIPGLLNDADLWRDQIAALSDVATCRVADITRGETLRALAEGVLADAPPAFALAGFSLGGYVAQEVMRIAPEQVTHLALLDTSIRADSPARAAERQALARAARAPGRFHGFGDRLLPTYLHPSHLDDAEIVCRIQDMTRRLGPDTFLRQNAVERKDGEAVIRSLSCPLLILCGENDVLTPLSEHRAMARLVPHAVLVVVADSGHMTPLENPDAVSGALRAWLTTDAADWPKEGFP